MYFAVSKILFDPESSSQLDRKTLHALVDKLRAQFRICVEVSGNVEDTGHAELAICALDRTANRLSQLFDKIVEFCERSEGIRVADDPTIIEDVGIVEDEE